VKIEKHVQGQTTTIHLIGHFHLDHLVELRKQVEHGDEVILDLREITIVDADVVRFFVECKRKGMKIAHCPRYIKRWMPRETKT
jgi:hypothetical protein